MEWLKVRFGEHSTLEGAVLSVAGLLVLVIPDVWELIAGAAAMIIGADRVVRKEKANEEA